MDKPVILTGIRANNDIHIGNYFGAIMPIVRMAKERSDEYQINLFIPDLHSITTPVDYSKLYDTIINNARIYAAAGLPLENDSIYMYRQSYIPAHSEMTLLLNNFVGFGEMSRMTQFKDKSGIYEQKEILNDIKEALDTYRDGAALLARTQQLDLHNRVLSSMNYTDKSSVGLFDYPVLMAADILLYGAKYVPVGDDQTQHLEITRDIAMRMNGRFGELFTVPESVKDQHAFFGKEQGLRIKDLVDPSKKMSKSDDTGKGVIFLSDTPEDAAKKIMGATTDDKAEINYDKENQPGISNLLDILALLRDKPLEEVIAEFKGQARYGDFKKVVADEMAGFLRDFQARLASVDDTVIMNKLESSETAMNETARKTLYKVQQAVGLRGNQ